MIIPLDRRIDWILGDTVGRPLGIPNWTTVVQTADAGTYGGNDVDAAAHLMSKINAGSGTSSVVSIPAGVYRIDNQVYNPYVNNVVIRGDVDENGDPTTEIIAGVDHLSMLLFGSDASPFATSQVLLGNLAKGATSFQIADTTNVAVGGPRPYAVGDLVTLSQTCLPYVIRYADPANRNTRIHTWTPRVTSVPNGTTVNFYPPIPFALTESPAALHYYTTPAQNVGLENIILNGDGLSEAQLTLVCAHSCWLKNVVFKNSKNNNLVGIVASQIALRSCDFVHATGLGSNHEACDLNDRCCAFSVEDNITDGVDGFILGDASGGCSGNYFAYNFGYAARYDVNTAVADLAMHGGHNCYNCFEGNIMGGYNVDGYFASVSHNTHLRGWYHGTHPTAPNNHVCYAVHRGSNYENAVGCIFGDGTGSPTYEKIGYPNIGNFSSVGTWGPTDPPDYSTQYLNQPGGDGHGSGGDMLQEFDYNPGATRLKHGCLSYATGTQTWETDNTNVADHTDHDIPESYGYAEAPDYWPVGLAWPPIDPANPPGAFTKVTAQIIPAGIRWVRRYQTPSITSDSTAKAYKGEPFSLQVETDIPATSFTLTGGPAWMSFNTTTGLATGTPPTATGVSNITITATNTTGPSQDFSLTLTTFDSRTELITAAADGLVPASVVFGNIDKSAESLGHN